MEDCVFCKIIKGTLPGYIITEERDLIVFLSLETHPLIVPKKHFPDLFTLEEETATSVMRMSKIIAKAIKETFASDGVYISQANGEAAGQEVFHYHMHVYPKWSDGHSMAIDNDSKKLVKSKIQKWLKDNSYYKANS